MASSERIGDGEAVMDGEDSGTAAVIALGSNLPGGHASVQALLEAALARFPEVGLEPRRRSSFWRSQAWPDPAKPAYLNAVALVRTTLSAEESLAALMGIERAFGRERRAPNAPRTLDLDLIDYGAEVVDRPGLVLPHPRAHARLFVMGPLAEIAPDWRHPILGLTAEALALTAAIGRDARPLRP